MWLDDDVTGIPHVVTWTGYLAADSQGHFRAEKLMEVFM
jgi:hypothetical protein